jgi:DNA polymerase III sliding clamp (beta) subunit (PCNA family)
MLIKSDTKFLLNKIVSQFSKSGYDDRWANLEITICDNKLYLTGGGIGMVIVVRVDTEGTASDFAGQVDLRRFFETIKFMGKDIEIEFGSSITLSKGSRKVQFSYTKNTFSNILPLPVDLMVGSKQGIKMEIYPEYIKNLIEFVSNDQLRPSITAIYVSTFKSRTSYTATDAFHLLEIYTKMNKVEPFLLDPGIPFVFDEDIYVTQKGNHIIYNSDSWGVYQNIIQNNSYPNFRKVLDQLYGSWKTIIVNRKDMIYALKSAMGFAGGRKSASITFTIDKDEMHMVSRNKFAAGSDIYTDKIKIKNRDNIDTKVTFFTKYFLDGIVASGEEDVMLNFAANNYIFVAENDRRILMLPIKEEDEI